MSDVPTRDTDGESWWRRIAACEPMAWADQREFLGWTFAWALSFVAASWALRADLIEGPPAWAVALLPDVIGIAALLAYVRFLHRADELMQRIQLEGLALGFGAGVIFATGYHLLERAGAPRLGISDPVIVMMVTWAVGQLLALWRYR